MGKRILGIVVAIAAVALVYLGYVRYRDTQAESGEVHGDLPSLTPPSAASGSGSAVSQARTAPVPAPQPALTGTAPAVPATDSIAPNPVNGLAYAGSGKFEVYRQGNLTWRVDTETGHTCILFATMEEWQKPIVYENGCTKN